ncbi:hypothetical protein [Pontixanthobacter aquaemixtae]|uniref:Uncharacterized protein n=1 Tax=Pontixanthobacter aquaemixtae TaxID=1958940 RepID=A0A844ZUI0_9SPHN|nr:hypothetical protein [Pontixanthobacter aquaemixtae]MXO90770.1 hypothetical protein [Pontixanthobacter aquaemixtae]
MKRIIFAAASMALVSACGSERSGSYETDNGEKVEYSVDTSSGETNATIETEDGTAKIRSGADVEVDLPDGFSLYPGAKVVTNTTFNQADGKGSMIIFTSGDKAADIVSYYRKQAEAAGVKIEMEMKTAQGTMLAGKGEGDKVFSVNANEKDGETTAQMMVGEGIN